MFSIVTMLSFSVPVNSYNWFRDINRAVQIKKEIVPVSCIFKCLSSLIDN